MIELTNYTLMIVEDDEVMQEQLKELLAPEVRELYQAFDGVEGFELFKKSRPDVVLSDIAMPRMDGLEMAKRIKKLDPNRPILISSAYGDKDLLLRALNQQIDGYILKPINDIEQLLGELERVIEQSIRQTAGARDEAEELKKKYSRIIQKLHMRSHYDQMTRIPNRYMYQHSLKKAIETAKNNNSSVALMFIDMDDLKKINDTHGHQLGDQVIRIFVHNIKEVIDSKNTFARIGGDEFALIVESCDDKKSLAELAMDILQASAKPVYYHGVSVSVTCSIGISVYPSDTTSASELVSQADKAMYDVKNTGKRGYKFYINQDNEG